ncbi:MAG: hypothetical protein ACM3XM_17685 [Mycobacterium leprae]
MTLLLVIALSTWGFIYTGSLCLAVWKCGNKRGGVGTGILAVMTLVVPIAAHYLARLM